MDHSAAPHLPPATHPPLGTRTRARSPATAPAAASGQRCRPTAVLTSGAVARGCPLTDSRSRTDGTRPGRPQRRQDPARPGHRATELPTAERNSRPTGCPDHSPGVPSPRTRRASSGYRFPRREFRHPGPRPCPDADPTRPRRAYPTNHHCPPTGSAPRSVRLGDQLPGRWLVRVGRWGSGNVTL